MVQCSSTICVAWVPSQRVTMSSVGPDVESRNWFHIVVVKSHRCWGAVA